MSLFPLKNFPLDIRKRILKVQSKMKIKKGIAQYSIALTLCQIIKEHEEMEERLKNANN